MDKNEVLMTYERLAGLTDKMAKAAQTDSWSDFTRLENQCTSEVNGIKNKTMPALDGTKRLRKIDLLKQILANDREIRAITESSDNRADMRVHH